MLFTDGRVLGDGIGTKTVAAWRGDTLEVDTRGPLGSKSETWSLDGDQLTVTTAFELGHGGGFAFTTVYHRVEGSGRAGEGDWARVAAVEAEPPTPRALPVRPPARPTPTSHRPDPPTQPVPMTNRTSTTRADESLAGISKIRLLPPPPKPGGGLLLGQSRLRHPDHRPRGRGRRVLSRRRARLAPRLAAVRDQAHPRRSAARAGGARRGAGRQRSRAGRGLAGGQSRRSTVPRPHRVDREDRPAARSRCGPTSRYRDGPSSSEWRSSWATARSAR